MEPRALIVEDDRSWQGILTELLQDQGLRVDVADNLESALAQLRLHSHRIAVVDLSLQDVNHRNRDGLKVLDAARRHDPSCATILLTGFATVELAVSVLKDYGAVTCLQKENFQRNQFREVIRQVLANPPVAAVHLEARAGTAPAAPTVVARSSAPLGQALVVDDDAGWRSILNELLSDAGYSVHLCSSFGEALGRLRREKYTLAVVDLSLNGQIPTLNSRGLAPGAAASAGELEGYRLLSSTRLDHVPTVVVSGVGTPGDIERAYREQGIFAYMEKQSFDRRVFLRTVQEAQAARQVPSELDELTDREREVLKLLAQGLPNKDIAAQLVISENTVKRHIKAIYRKLNIHTRSAAVKAVLSLGGSTGD